MDYKEIFSQDSAIIEYSNRYLSQDKKNLALLKWGKRDKDTGFIMQDICFFNIPTKKIYSKTIRNLLNKSEFWYIERDGISWDFKNNFYFSINYLNGDSKLYKYNLESKVLDKIDVKLKNVSIKLLAISPDGQKIAFIGHEKRKKGDTNINLYLYNLLKKSISIFEKNVDSFRPVWLSGSEEIIYLKNNNLYLKKLLSDDMVKLTDFTAGLIVYSQTRIKGNRIFFIRQEPMPDILVEQTKKWLESEKIDNRTMPMYIKEFWELDINSYRKKLIKSFRTMKGGLFWDDSSLIISLPDEKEDYHLWWYKTDGSLEQLTFGNVADDLPIKIAENTIVFRRNYKNIMTLHMGE